MVKPTWIVAALLATGCGPPRHGTFDDFNSRDVGSYQTLERQEGQDGSVLVHVAATQPQHAEEIAGQIVRQNLALSPPVIRVVVDPVGEGERHVYRWDGHGLAVDTSLAGLPPRVPRPATTGAGASAH